VTATVAAARERGYEVILAGLPGDRQRGSAIVASSIPLATPSSAWDVAPTVLDLLGFPLSAEMPGRSLASGPPQQRIVSYGERAASGPAPALNREYYETLRSLGYVR
jgi:arylsulfatase A-like enzyme